MAESLFLSKICIWLLKLSWSNICNLIKLMSRSQNVTLKSLHSFHFDSSLFRTLTLGSTPWDYLTAKSILLRTSWLYLKPNICTDLCWLLWESVLQQPKSYQISSIQSFGSPRWKFICADFTDDCGKT